MGGIRVERRKSARHPLYLKSAIVLGQEARGALIKFGKGSPRLPPKIEEHCVGFGLLSRKNAFGDEWLIIITSSADR